MQWIPHRTYGGCLCSAAGCNSANVKEITIMLRVSSCPAQEDKSKLDLGRHNLHRWGHCSPCASPRIRLQACCCEAGPAGWARLIYPHMPVFLSSCSLVTAVPRACLQRTTHVMGTLLYNPSLPAPQTNHTLALSRTPLLAAMSIGHSIWTSLKPEIEQERCMYPCDDASLNRKAQT